MDDYSVTFYSAVECHVTIRAESEADARRRFDENDYHGAAEVVNGGLFVDLTENLLSDMPVFIIPAQGGREELIKV